MKDKLAKIIRVITVAPLMALVMLLLLFLRSPQRFGSPVHFVLAVLFLTVFPLLAYPLQPFIKKYKDQGRGGQRNLAMVFAVSGYVGGCLFAVILQAPKYVAMIYLTYLLCGVMVTLCNKLLHFKASGHSCGITGPFTMLVVWGQPLGYIGIPILALAWLSSLQMKRHTNLQLLVGSAIPIIAFGIVSLVFSTV